MRHSLVVATLSLSVVAAIQANLPGQAVGNWLPPVNFPTNTVGCAGSTEAVYAVHAALIPGTTGRVLIWGRGSNTSCWFPLLAGTSPGDYEQQFAIVDADASPATVTYGVWRIPAAFAPPIFAGSHPNPFNPSTNVTNGVQGLFCAGHCWLPDGRLFVVGGNDWSASVTHPNADFTGSRMVAVYDPTIGPLGTWRTGQEPQVQPSPIAFLERPRWYPTPVVTVDTAELVPTIKIIVLGGIEQLNRTADPNGEGNGLFWPSDRAYLTHEAYDVALLGSTWTITKDSRQGSALPSNYSPNTPVNGLFIGPATTTPDLAYQLGYSLFYYARAHYLSNGVFGGAPAFFRGIAWIGGMPAVTTWIDHPVDPNSWPLPQPLLTTTAEMLEEPMAVLLPASLGGGGEDRIAVLGGQYGLDTMPPTQITNHVRVLDAKVASPTWSTTAIPSMNHRRKFANAVLLPDSSLLVVGGGTNPVHSATGGEVFTPEVFRGTSWQDGPAEASPRTYHSCSLLLPSGRVLSIGGDTRRYDMQVYEPHYWQAGGTRPVITTAPATMAYNNTASVAFTLAPGRTLAKASLTTPGAVTHSHDPNQRLVELPIVSSTGTGAVLATPINPTKAPYGFYMLWLVDSAGEVSAAAWTRL